MQPLSGNQRPDLLTSLMNMSLVPLSPREMHLSRSSSNVPRLPSFLDMPQSPHILLTFGKVQNPLRLPRNTTSEPPKVARTCGALCIWLGNVLRATTACTFSTSQVPKVIRTWCVLYILTWKCASRHNNVHFFDISTSKSGPNMVCFVFCTFWLPHVLRVRRACTFSTAQLPKVLHTWGVFRFFTCKCASRHNSVQLFTSYLVRWLCARRFSEPTCRLSYLFAHLQLLSSHSFSSLIFSLLLFSCLALPTSAFPSVHIVGSLSSKLPSINQPINLSVYPVYPSIKSIRSITSIKSVKSNKSTKPIESIESYLPLPNYIYLYLSLSISIYLYLSLSISIYLYLSIYLSIYLYLSISIYIYLYLSISIYIYLYLSISIYIYLYLSISIYIYLYLSISIYIYLYLSISIYIYLYLSISIYIYLSIYLSICSFALLRAQIRPEPPCRSTWAAAAAGCVMAGCRPKPLFPPRLMFHHFVFHFSCAFSLCSFSLCSSTASLVARDVLGLLCQTWPDGASDDGTCVENEVGHQSTGPKRTKTDTLVSLLPQSAALRWLHIV